MCGIAGRFNLDGRPVQPAAISLMCEMLVHRGPDDAGQYVSGSVGLGIRRLSIIDLVGGHQPMQNEDGSRTIVFNGEIYNYRELRARLEARGHHFHTASDTESILCAYDEYGVDCLEHLNGMFAFAIWDSALQRLFVARDRLGIKPLYLYHDREQIRFASEAKALLADRELPRSLDLDAFAYFFRYGYVAAASTLFKGIRKLPAAHYLLADANGVREHRYWKLAAHESDGSQAHFERQIYEGLETAVRRQLVADVPVGAFLSGGLDSSSIVSFACGAPGRRISTFTIGFRGSDEFHSELADARAISARHGTDHHEIVVQPDAAKVIPTLVYHLDEPLADSSCVVTYLVSKLAASSVKVVLSGVGGDELFGGYRRYLGPRLTPYYHSMPALLQRGIEAVAARSPVDRGSRFANLMRLGRSFLSAQHLPPYEQYDRVVRLLSEETLAELAPSIPAGLSGLDAARRETFDCANGIDPVSRLMRLDLDTSLVESLLLLTDKMSMAVSLEARVPFLDHELVEIAAAVPGRLKIHGTRLRHIQKAAMRPELPPRVIRKAKRGFGFPIGRGFRNGLRELLEDTLSEAKVRRQGLFEPKALARLMSEHRARRSDYSDVLFALLTFGIWYDRWLDG
jgi:asparagine synthase (glutamine-hydrolysing)